MTENTNTPETEAQGAPTQPTPTPPQPGSPPPVNPKAYVLPYALLGVSLLTLFGMPLFIVSLFLAGPMKEPKTIIIPRGSSVQEIGTLLDQNDVLINPLLFRITAKLLANNNLKAGEYQFKPGQSVMDVTEILRDGKVVLRQFTAAEGLTSHEITTLLQNTPALTGDVKTVPPEGSLMPESYRFTHGDTRESIIARMQKDAAALLDELWKGREENLPLKSPREALILASVVEKETGKMAAERPLVASVFINRLRANMPLQSDPTVIYALTGGTGTLGRSLTRADLLTPSPFNTYYTPGLPPTPICNPGRAALEAVLHPERSDYLYFVANGTGGHAFARTLTEHNQNVSKWIQLNRP